MRFNSDTALPSSKCSRRIFTFSSSLGDSNLYVRRRGDTLTLSTEHRAAPSQDHIPLQLSGSASALALSVTNTDSSNLAAETEASPLERVRHTLAQMDQPTSIQQLRKICGMRTATLCRSLAQLTERGLVTRTTKGYELKHAFPPPPFPVSRSTHPQGNGNGKQEL